MQSHEMLAPMSDMSFLDDLPLCKRGYNIHKVNEWRIFGYNSEFAIFAACDSQRNKVT